MNCFRGLNGLPPVRTIFPKHCSYSVYPQQEIPQKSPLNQADSPIDVWSNKSNPLHVKKKISLCVHILVG